MRSKCPPNGRKGRSSSIPAESTASLVPLLHSLRDIVLPSPHLKKMTVKEPGRAPSDKLILYGSMGPTLFR